MSTTEPKPAIGISLSGGGFRATVFHLGVLARLAVQHRLEDVGFVSSVSGGTLCAGLVHTLNKNQWPSSDVYLGQVVPAARKLMTTKRLDWDVVLRQLLTIWTIFGSRASNLSAVLRCEWGVKGRLGELSPHPRWMINATCYETAKDWRFEQFRMGDYVYGYTYDVADVRVSDAMAASAGFPIAIGPLALDTSKYRNWFDYVRHNPHAGTGDLLTPEEQKRQSTTPRPQPTSPVHLWDGGVYDNYGLEGLSDPDSGWRQGVNFLIVSDAAGVTGFEAYRWGFPALWRMVVDIMLDQIRSMRARSIVERMINHADPGGFIKLGNSCAKVLGQANGKPGAINLSQSDINKRCDSCLNVDALKSILKYQSEIGRLPPEMFDLMFRHGFEVADYTLSAYYPDDYPHITYQDFVSRRP